MIRQRWRRGWWLIGVGAVMFVATVVVQTGVDWSTFGANAMLRFIATVAAMRVAGLALFAWGCIDVARAKGQGWVMGLGMAFLGPLGAVMLWFMQDRILDVERGFPVITTRGERTGS